MSRRRRLSGREGNLPAQSLTDYVMQLYGHYNITFHNIKCLLAQFQIASPCSFPIRACYRLTPDRCYYGQAARTYPNPIIRQHSRKEQALVMTPLRPQRIVIAGAAGRDFHDFQVVFRDDPTVEVVGFTATQIPGLDARRFPAALAGPLYPDGIGIHPEAELEQLVRSLGVDEVVLSYSDLALHLVERRDSEHGHVTADFVAQ